MQYDLALTCRIAYAIYVRFTWDDAKAAANLAKHGLGFELVERFDWETALIQADVRFSYPEPRLLALGAIEDQLLALVYTVEYRSTRLISLRKASKKEVRRYEAG